jgi:hypothetical protein
MVHSASVWSTTVYGGMKPYSSKLRSLAKAMAPAFEHRAVCHMVQSLCPEEYSGAWGA